MESTSVMSQEQEQQENPERQFTKEIEWFMRMEGALSWRIVPPDLWSPYRPVLSDRVIAELAHSKDVLKSAFEVKCFCDGYEVLRVKNLLSPLLLTEHPCLTGLKYDELKRYWFVEGIIREIDDEISRIQAALREQLDEKEILDAQQQKPTAKRKSKEQKKGSLPLPLPPVLLEDSPYERAGFPG